MKTKLIVLGILGLTGYAAYRAWISYRDWAIARGPTPKTNPAYWVQYLIDRVIQPTVSLET